MESPPEVNLHWSKKKEKASRYGPIKLLLIIFKFFPPIVLRLLAFPVGFFYFVFSSSARKDAARFLQRALPKGSYGPFGSPLKNIVSFSLALVEKMEAWGGKYPFKKLHFMNDGIKELIDNLEKKKGAVLICSHLGNAELLRGLANFNLTGVSGNVRVTSLVNVSVTENFNRMLEELNPDSKLRLVSVNEITPYTVIGLQEKLALGELVVIAGDRTSAASPDAVFMLPFLGEDAPFPRGVFILSSLLDAPVYTVFALRQGALSIKGEYGFYVHKNDIDFNCSRQERKARIHKLAFLFAERLEYYCKKYPHQWYNFYDFWSKGK
jgi:predicted LPLAT superfamily acyltransferase